MSAESELSSLVSAAARIRDLAAETEWSDTDDNRLVRGADEMYAQAVDDATGIAAAGAGAQWTARANELRDEAAATVSPGSTAADTAIAVAIARAAIAQAGMSVAHQVAGDPDMAGRSESAQLAAGARVGATEVGRETVAEFDHVLLARPHSILIRLAITIGISIAVVVGYRVTGLSAKYDSYSALALFLLSAVVGSSICTNALCVDAQRVRAQLREAVPLWQILLSKNLTMLVAVFTAGSLVIVALDVIDGDLGLVSMFAQLLTMIFVWLGVGDVLSVVYPLRQEPLAARLRDSTWKPYLQGFAVSYVVGLAVNLMIYWQLWAKDVASDRLAGGQWGALAAVVASSVAIWLLLALCALVCAQYPPIRRALSREMDTADH